LTKWSLHDLNVKKLLAETLAGIYVDRCFAYSVKQDNRAVLSDCNSALLLDQSNIRAYYFRGTIYEFTGHIDAADGGASDVSIPVEAVLTLTHAGTITRADFLGTGHYRLADGSNIDGEKVRIHTLQV
jgi:hypothetical protein